MNDPERRYMESIEKSIEQLGSIQRTFVLDKNGIRAIVRLIEEMGGAPPVFSLDDPVILKGRAAALRVVEELAAQLATLEAIDAPDIWAHFHQSLVTSIGLQLQGYRAMTRVFDDSNPRHLAEGQELVTRGMAMLEAGSRSEAQPEPGDPET